MSRIGNISVSLSPEMAATVNQAVESGDYGAAGEVVREALREWTERRSLVRNDRERLRQLWEEGIASGPGRLGDVGAIKAEARRRFMDEHLKAAS